MFWASFLGLYETVSKICTNFKQEVLQLLISQNTELCALHNFQLRCSSRNQQIVAFAFSSVFIPQKRHNHVSVLGESSLQIVWKALMYLTQLKGHSFPFLKIRVQSGTAHYLRIQIFPHRTY